MMHLRYTYDSYKITAEADFQGADLLVRIYGGDAPHIGSIAMAEPRKSLSGGGKTSATVSVFNYCGHMDDALATPIAKALAAALNAKVVCVCGVHYESPSAELLSGVQALTDTILSDILNGFKI